MSAFTNALNESAVTYVRDLSAYGWEEGMWDGMTGPGWEAYSPFGEVRAFLTYDAAHAWRLSEVREYVRITTGR